MDPSLVRFILKIHLQGITLDAVEDLGTSFQVPLAVSSSSSFLAASRKSSLYSDRIASSHVRISGFVLGFTALPAKGFGVLKNPWCRSHWWNAATGEALAKKVSLLALRRSLLRRVGVEDASVVLLVGSAVGRAFNGFRCRLIRLISSIMSVTFLVSVFSL